MPPHSRWAEPVSRPPVPHCQRTTQPVRVHGQHRATIGVSFDRLAVLEREEAQALFTELDCSWNQQRHPGDPVRTSAGLSIHTAPPHSDESSVTFYDDPAGQIQLSTAACYHDAREDVHHVSNGTPFSW